MRTTAAGVLAALLIMTAAPLLAKHTFTSDYDVGKPLTLSGKVVKFDWSNPRSWITFEVTSPEGTKTLWTGEGRSMSVLSKTGWTKSKLEETFRAGDTLSVLGFSSKDGSPRLYATSAVRSDGKTLDLGPPPIN